MKIEVLSADHQNKADVAIGIVRDWFDNKGVNAVSDIVQATVQVAVQHEAASHNRIALFTGGTARLTNEDCAPATSVMWMWDTYGLTAGITRPLAKPGSKWFFITADYVFGKSLQTDATALVQAAGGTVVGSVSHPFSYTGDFSPLLLQAQASGADIIALANSGTDLINSIKQGREFGVGSGKQSLASFALSLPDVAAIGLADASGVLVNEAVLLGPGRPHPRVVPPLRAAQWWPHAVQHPGRGLRGGTRLFPGRGSRENHRHRPSDGQAARVAAGRHAGPPSHAAARRPYGARHLPASGEDPGGVEGTIRFLHARRDDPGRGCLPPHYPKACAPPSRSDAPPSPPVQPEGACYGATRISTSACVRCWVTCRIAASNLPGRSAALSTLAVQARLARAT